MRATAGRLLILGAALLAGGLLVGLIVEGNRFDGSLVDAVASERSPAWTAAARLVTQLGGPGLDVIFAAAVLGLVVADRRRDAVFVLVAAGGAMLVTNAMKYVLERPRPAGGGLVSVASASWPSGHASSSIALYGALALLAVRRRSGPTRAAIWIGVVAIVAAIGATRVYLGVHYPTDVAAGWAVGGAWLVGVLRLVGLAERRT